MRAPPASASSSALHHLPRPDADAQRMALRGLRARARSRGRPLNARTSTPRARIARASAGARDVGTKTKFAADGSGSKPERAQRGREPLADLPPPARRARAPTRAHRRRPSAASAAALGERVHLVRPARPSRPRRTAALPDAVADAQPRQPERLGERARRRARRSCRATRSTNDVRRELGVRLVDDARGPPRCATTYSTASRDIARRRGVVRRAEVDDLRAPVQQSARRRRRSRAVSGTRDRHQPVQSREDRDHREGRRRERDRVARLAERADRAVEHVVRAAAGHDARCRSRTQPDVAQRRASRSGVEYSAG